jgi:hypothetical protein
MTRWKDNNFADDKLPSTEDANSQTELETEENGLQQTSNDGNGQPLEKTKSFASRKSDIDPFGEPPDGGLNAWLKVLGCFLLYSNIW